jgi:Peptidase family M28
MRWLVVRVAVACAVLAVAPTASARFEGDRAKGWTRAIAQVGHRPAGGLHERQAAAIVRRRFAALGYDVWVQRFALPNGGRSLNVVAASPGPLRAIVVAHMDGVHHTQAANDNASGVGTVLELARNLRGARGVRLAALGAEERYVTGSPYHLGSLRFVRNMRPVVKRGVRLALSVDMVGRGATFHVRGLEASPNRSARRLLRSARALGVPRTYLRDTGQSDHDDLTRGGVPAAWVTWRWDDCWHRPCDQIRRVKPWKLWVAGRVVLRAVRVALD